MNDEKQDRALLVAVAEIRDRNAFAELAERHQRAAFNLALYLTHNRDTAEEAVQESLIRMWRFANTYVDEGNVRSWFLRIVANESLRLARGRLRDRMEMTQSEQFEAAAERIGPEESIMQAERTAVLRECMDNLPPLQRRLVALYYIAGIEQKEIGETVGLSQQNVSHNIKNALNRLRASLTEAGFAAMLPLLDGQSLGLELSAGHPAPQNVIAKALDCIQSVPLAGTLAAASARASRRAAGSGWGAGTAAFLLLGAAMAAGAWWLSQQPPAHDAEVAANVPAPEFETQAAPPAAVPKDEIVLDEEFDGNEISSFFDGFDPKPTARMKVAIQSKGNLALVAAEPKFLIEGKYRAFRRAEIRSRWVPLNGRPVLILFPSRTVVFEGPYELGVRFETQDGVTLHETKQIRSGADSTSLRYEHRNAAGPSEHKLNMKAPIIGLLVEPGGQVYGVHDDGRINAFGWQKLKVEKVRLCLCCAALGESGYVIWEYRRLRVMRLGERPESRRIEIPDGWHYE